MLSWFFACQVILAIFMSDAEWTVWILFFPLNSTEWSFSLFVYSRQLTQLNSNYSPCLPRKEQELIYKSTLLAWPGLWESWGSGRNANQDHAPRKRAPWFLGVSTLLCQWLQLPIPSSGSSSTKTTSMQPSSSCPTWHQTGHCCKNGKVHLPFFQVCSVSHVSFYVFTLWVWVLFLNREPYFMSEQSLYLWGDQFSRSLPGHPFLAVLTDWQITSHSLGAQLLTLQTELLAASYFCPLLALFIYCYYSISYKLCTSLWLRW